MSRTSLNGRRRGVVYLGLTALLALFVAPFVWLAITALKSVAELAAYPLRWLPDPPHWENFTAALTTIDFLRYTGNSLIIAGAFAVLVTLSSAAVGFGFARLRAPGKRALFGVLIGSMMLPHIITLIPTYLIFAELNLVDTYWPWVLWGLAGAPFLIFLFRQFFAGVPIELEEAAILDGCGHIRIFLQIFLPQSWPALSTSLILSFTYAWGDYVAPLLLLSQDNTTLAVALAQGYTDPVGNPLNNLVAAGAVMYVLPVLMLFLIVQRKIASGFATSGLK